MKLSIYQTILPMAVAQQTDDSRPMVISLFDHMTNLNLGLALEHQPSPNDIENDQSEDNSNDLLIKSEEYNVTDSENEIGGKNNNTNLEAVFVTEENNSEINTELVAENDDAADGVAIDQPNIQDLASVLNNLNIVDPVESISDALYDLSNDENDDDLDDLGDLGIARSRKRKPKRKNKKPKHVPKEIIELNSCTIGAYDCQENAECKTLYNDLHEGLFASVWISLFQNSFRNCLARAEIVKNGLG